MHARHRVIDAGGEIQLAATLPECYAICLTATNNVLNYSPRFRQPILLTERHDGFYSASRSFTAASPLPFDDAFLFSLMPTIYSFIRNVYDGHSGRIIADAR